MRGAGSPSAVVAAHGSHLDELRAFLAPYDAESTAPVTGIDADVVRELAVAWIATPRASVHASTGLNMGRQGSLAYWLVHMLSFVTGRLDVEGGNLKSDGFYANARSGAGAVEQGYVDTEFGRLRRGALPGTLMADAILDSAEPVRAMIVVAGNPLLSIAGEERLRKAFEQLELLVVIDIYPSATAELADVVLPCTDMYERDDLNVVNIGTSATTVRAVHAGRRGAGRANASRSGGSPTACCRSSGTRRSSTTTRRIRGRSGGTCCSAAPASSSPTCRRAATSTCCRRRRRASSSTSRCGPPTARSTAARRSSPARLRAASCCSSRSCANATRCG